jgi:hypothetical protein
LYLDNDIIPDILLISNELFTVIEVEESETLMNEDSIKEDIDADILNFDDLDDPDAFE